MLKRLLVTHSSRHWPLSRSLTTAARLYLYNYYSVANYQFESNGEGSLIRVVSKFAPRMIFDVGANEGEWASAAASACPEAAIHCFEVSPVTFAQLQQRLGASPRFTLNGFGLSSRNAELEIFHDDGNTSITSVHRPASLTSIKKVQSRVVTGSSYLRQHNINAIDLLKIDTEGHDFDVLRGLEEFLPKCTVIQFEYNELSFARGIFVEDYRSCLKDFVVGRLTRAGVIWDLEPLSHFRLLPGNMVAVRRDRPDIIAALRRFT